MPDRVDTAGAILDLVAVARATGVTIDGLQPSDPTPATSSGYESVPLTATVSGKYGQLTNFLAGMQRLVVVRHGQFWTRAAVSSASTRSTSPPVTRAFRRSSPR